MERKGAAMKKRKAICILLTVVLVVGVFGFASAQEITPNMPIEASDENTVRNDETHEPTASEDGSKIGENNEEPESPASVEPAEQTLKQPIEQAQEFEAEINDPIMPPAEEPATEENLLIAPFAATNEATLRADVLNAAAGGVVEISGNIQLTSTPLMVDKNLTFRSTGGTIELSVAGNIRHIDAAAGVALTFEGVELTGNAPADGGGINAQGAITLNGAVIKNCQAAQGGGVNAAGGITLNGSTLTGNKAAGDGGGAYGNGTVLISGSTINQNTAAGDGGGLYSAGNFTLTSGTITGNDADRGGGVYTLAPNTFLRGGIISGNTAQQDGGGVYGVVTYMLGGTIADNHALADGGGLFVVNITVESGQINGNIADGRGGGIYADNWIEINNGTISENRAENGGGISTIGDVDFNQGFITGNTALQDGGGIYGTLANIFVQSGAVFADNSASRGYQIKEEDKALYASNVHTANITQPFTYAYNNFDINYTGTEIEYVVTFDPQGGSTVDPALVTAGSVVGRPADPVREGYTFTGWFKDAAATQPWDFATAINSNITLYAGWQEGIMPAVVYTVTFDSRGGSTVAAITNIAAGSTIDAPAAPKRDGYTFRGWFTDEAVTQKWDFAADTVDKNMTLYAGWTPAGNVPKTGDTSTLWPYVWGAAAGTLLLMGLIIKMNNRRKKENN